MYTVVLLTAMSAGSQAPACWHSCHGCYTACYGCSGSYGCTGYYGCYSCSGCYGCYRSACHGCYGNYGCHGCYTSHRCASGCYGFSTYHPVPAPPQKMAPAPDSKPTTPPKKEGSASTLLPSNWARVIVQLPADARLYVDDQPMETTSARRVFRTPALEPDQIYYYELRGEIVREGKTLSQSKRILIRAGEEAHVSLGDLVPRAFVQAD
jgi:uncharacterized protein (TIGR03000 family)